MVAGVEAAGLTDDTIFVLSSDHGDMQMYGTITPVFHYPPRSLLEYRG